MSVLYFIFLFFLYSFIGWIGDTAYRSFYERRYAPGSFFPVPLCPVYGVGAVLVLVLDGFFHAAPLVLQWVVYGLLLAGLEEATGVFLLVFFKRRLWSYPDGRKKKGRFTDIGHAMLWGALAVLLVRYVHPFIGSSVSALTALF